MMSVVVFADDSSSSCGLEKRDVIKAVIAYLKDDSGAMIKKQHVLTLIKAYLGSVSCSSNSVHDAKDVVDDIPDDVVPTCPDGTYYSSCSSDKPLYCHMGQLVERCDLCCDSGLCDQDGTCADEPADEPDEEEDTSDTVGPTYVDCGTLYGDDYWCSDYDEWKLECGGLGGYIDLTGGACVRDDGAYGTHCVTCANTTSYNRWVFQLHEGVNMISFPMIPSNNSVEAVFSQVAGNLETVWAYDPSAVDPWIGYSPSATVGNDLKFIVPYDGYKVLMAADDTLIVSGVPAVLYSSDLLASLSTGYNLVGSGMYGVSIYGIKGEWQFDEDSVPEYHMSLEPGKGYWIQCNTTDVFADLVDNDCDGIVDEASS